MTAFTMNRRVFVALAPAAAAGRVLASMPLAKLAPAAIPARLFLAPGVGEVRACFGADYQAGLGRVRRALIAHDLQVEVRDCREPRHAGAIFPVLHVHGDFLPAALAPALQAWQGARAGRSITFSRAGYVAALDTPEQWAAVCCL